MTVLDDITFQQLSEALPAGSVTFSAGSPIINVKAITNDFYDTQGDFGVVKFLYKLREACGSAQSAANAVLTETDVPLEAFPDYSYGVPNAQGKVPVSQVTQVFLALDTNNIKGLTTGESSTSNEFPAIQ